MFFFIWWTTILFGWLLPATVQSTDPAQGELVLNEVQPWPIDAGTEYIELLNRSGTTLSLENVRIADARLFSSGISVAAEITGAEQIAPGEMLVVARNPELLPSPVSAVATLATWQTLNNGGDSIVLLIEGIAIESFTYQANQNEGNATLERVDPAAPSDWRGNWKASLNGPSGSPGLSNTVYAPDDEAPVLLSAEQMDSTSIALAWSEPIALQSISTAEYTLHGEIHSPAVSLSGDGHTLTARFAALRRDETIVVSGVTDLVGNVAAPATCLVAWIPRSDDLIINEVMYEPVADRFDGLPDQPEYIEFQNVGESLLSMRSCVLTDRPNELGAFSTIGLGDGSHSTKPDSYLVLVADPTADRFSTRSPMLDAAFPGSGLGNLAYHLIVRGSSLSLDNGGQQLTLSCASDTVEQLIYEPAWHSTLLESSAGRSLERIDARVAGDIGWNWSTSTGPEGGSPGSPNTVVLVPRDRAGQGSVVVDPEVFMPDGDGIDDFVSVTFMLAQENALVRSIVFDLNGRMVRRLEDALFVGQHGSVFWDGTNDQGDKCPTGAYVVWIEGLGTSVDVFKAVVLLAGLEK